MNGSDGYYLSWDVFMEIWIYYLIAIHPCIHCQLFDSNCNWFGVMIDDPPPTQRNATQRNPPFQLIWFERNKSKLWIKMREERIFFLCCCCCWLIGTVLSHHITSHHYWWGSGSSSNSNNIWCCCCCRQWGLLLLLLLLLLLSMTIWWSR